MSGELSGVQKQVQDQFPAAYYNHSVAHRMSLCASQTAKKIPRAAAFFDIVDKVIRFFRSSPRSRLLGRSLPRRGIHVGFHVMLRLESLIPVTKKLEVFFMRWHKMQLRKPKPEQLRGAFVFRSSKSNLFFSSNFIGKYLTFVRQSARPYKSQPSMQCSFHQCLMISRISCSN